MKWLLAFFYHILMFAVILFSLFHPFMLFDYIKAALKYDVPQDATPFSVISFFMLWIYIAMKSEFLGKPYRKLTIFLPLLQMIVYTTIALNVGLILLNKWADDGAYSKWVAIVLAIAGVVAVRLLMSLLYWKYPLVRKSDGR